jgi:hypothetical protein
MSKGSLTDDDDDDRPYQMDGPEEKPCLRCGKALPLGALVCNHCGYNQETGETLQRVYQKVDKQWEAGLRFEVRVGIYLAIMGLASMMTLIVAFVDGNIPGLLLSYLVGAALCAFVTGTYPRINLTRGTVGNVRLTRTWRVCFVPLETEEIRWRGCGGIVITTSGRTDFWDWLTMFALAPWGLVPAFLWWYFAVRPNQLDVALTREHGYSAVLLYRGRNEAMAHDIAGTIRNVTGLRTL